MILHSSNSYRVEVNDRGIEIKNLHTGDAIFFTGIDAEDTQREIAALADTEWAKEPRKPEHIDSYLRGFFED